ncbi:tropinesterase [mine drainage metagenome]|uniref:Tropinesterase n=1 Tax=mine drainage metagenome TaxID=410659 RepID=A0A1J5RJM0_9ZZZZ
MKIFRSDFLELRGRRVHVRSWGPASAPALFLLHGWMDVSASFQFLVDALAREWRLIAPDWRGFGGSQRNNDAYWFPDYVADLDALLEHYSPDRPVRLIGHSLGGNAACLYAGIRPERVERLATLEGFGLHVSDPADAPGRYGKWLAGLRAGPASNRYADRAALALRLQGVNPRLSAEQAAFLALHLGQETEAGDIVVAADPYHRLPSPILYRLDDAKACWRRITAPVLWVAARDSFIMKRFSDADGGADYQSRIACFADLRVEMLEDCGHNMHHDQPARLAALIEDFFP